MNRWMRCGLLLAGLGVATLLAGCPGMQGAGGGSAAQQTPPGILPPPGLKSGGVRSLVGATVTPPDKATLLVSYTTTHTPGRVALPVQTLWLSARRVTVTEEAVLLEGLNFDGRVATAEKDRNVLLPLAQVASLTWKYEAAPAATKAPANAPAKAPAGTKASAPTKAPAATKAPATKRGR